MSGFKCINCEHVNSYAPDSEFRRLWEVFEGIWYCFYCTKRYMIYMDIHGKTIEKETE